MFKSLKTLTEKPVRFKLCEFEMEVDGFSGNPFDPDHISIEAEVTGPEQKPFTVYGFYYEAFELEPSNRIVRHKPTNKSYRLRFSPKKAGDYQINIRLFINGVLKDSRKTAVSAADSNGRGVLSVEPKRRQAFQFENGELFFPIAQNMAAGTSQFEPTDTEEYLYKVVQYFYDHLGKMAANGANATRVWLSCWTLAMYDQNNRPDDFSARMDQLFALDKVINFMEEHGLYFILSLWQHCMFSNHNDAMWHESPFNINNKGYLSSPEQFFTSRRALIDAKKYMRYAISRWGYSNNIWSLELFNEIDGCDVDHGIATAWHEKMVPYIRSLDVYGRIVTTSTANTTCDIARSDLFDMICYHAYTDRYLQEIWDYQTDSFKRYGRPVFFEELGVTGIMYKYDPNMLSFHNANWAGMMYSGSCTAMNWWWEVVDRDDKYHEFKGVSAFSKLIPWDDIDLKCLNSEHFACTDENVDICGYKSSSSAYLWIRDKEYTFFQQLFKDPETKKIKTRGIKDGKHSMFWYDFSTCILIEIPDAEVKDNELLVEVSDNKTDIFIHLEAKKRDVTGQSFTVPGMEDGQYTIEWFDTLKGEIFASEQKNAENGSLAVSVPDFSIDLAVKITK